MKQDIDVLRNEEDQLQKEYCSPEVLLKLKKASIRYRSLSPIAFGGSSTSPEPTKRTPLGTFRSSQEKISDDPASSGFGSEHGKGSEAEISEPEEKQLADAVKTKGRVEIMGLISKHIDRKDEGIDDTVSSIEEESLEQTGIDIVDQGERDKIE